MVFYQLFAYLSAVRLVILFSCKTHIFFELHQKKGGRNLLFLSPFKICILSYQQNIDASNAVVTAFFVVFYFLPKTFIREVEHLLQAVHPLC